MDQIFQCPGTMQDVRFTRHRAAIIRCETQEELPDALISRLASLTGKEGWFTFNTEQIQPSDLTALPQMPEVEGKTPSQQLRAALWVLAGKQGVPETGFKGFYDKKMEYFRQLVLAEMQDYEESDIERSQG